MRHVERRYLQNQIVAAGHVMALAHLFERLRVIDHAVVTEAGAAHADEGHHLQAQGFAVNPRRIAFQNAIFLHLLEPLGDGGGGEADSAAEFGDAQAGIGLQFVKKFSTIRIEK